PETIACGVIYLAALKCGVSLPTSPPWWIVFDANEEDIRQVARAAVALHERSRLRVMPLDSDELEMHLRGELEDHVKATRHTRYETANASSKTASIASTV
ncbi:hypothetical protein GGI08_002143, partial [Coemansia sp. S2]